MTFNDSKWQRTNSFDTNVVILDGMTGTGKTMVMKILDTFKLVTPPKFNYQLEQLLIGIELGEIEKDFGIQVVQLLLDQIEYDLAIGREINIRPKDLSSIFSSSKRTSYIKNILKEDGRSVENRIKISKQDLLLVTHQLIDAVKIVNSIPGKKLNHILCVRHPYYLLNHWASYIPMHGDSPTDFTLTDGIRPWFIQKSQSLYMQSNVKERAMLSIIELSNKSLDYIERPNENLLIIDFEKFVLGPFTYLDSLSKELNSWDTNRLRRVMREQKLPRDHINDTINRSIYKRYASSTLSMNRSHEEDYCIMREHSKLDVAEEIFADFESVAKRYEDRFGIWF